MSKHIKSSLVDKWMNELDPNRQIFEFEKRSSESTSLLSCKVCKLFKDKLNHLRNFNDTFIKGTPITKKDSVVKHIQSEMHKYALNLKSKPENLKDFFKTPIGQVLKKTSNEEEEKVKKLIDISYFINKNELPLSKFAPLAELEKRHGVKLGERYANQVMCAEFTTLIGQHF